MKLALALSFAFSCLVPDEPAELGKVVPDLSLKDVNGKDLRLSDFRKSDKAEGKPLLVLFWSYKCPSGRVILEDVKKLAERCEKEGVAFLGLCAYGESEEQIKKYSDKERLTYTLCYDAGKKGTKLFGAKVVTASYVLDREGKLVYRGAWDKAWDAAAAVKAGKEVEVKETTPKG